MSESRPDPGDLPPQSDGIRKLRGALTSTALTAESPAQGQAGGILEVEYALVPEDIVAFSRYHAKHLARRHKIWRRLAIPATLAVMLVVCVPWPLSDERAWRQALANILGVGLFFLSVYGISWVWGVVDEALARRRLRRDPRLREKMTVRLSPDGLTVHDINGVTTTFWHATEQVAEEDGYAFIYIAKAVAEIVPAHAFRDTEQFKHFVETARHYHDEAHRFVRREGQA
jgi:hypothetical protein